MSDDSKSDNKQTESPFDLNDKGRQGVVTIDASKLPATYVTQMTVNVDKGNGILMLALMSGIPLQVNPTQFEAQYALSGVYALNRKNAEFLMERLKEFLDIEEGSENADSN